MSDTQQFEAAATVTVKTSPNDIWAIWADVNAWTNWDPGIERTEMKANFKSGTTFSLTPHGGEPIQVTIRTVTQGEEFSDEAVLPFGTIRTYHRIEALGERVKMTHEVIADIAADSVGFFEKQIWPQMQNGLPVSLNNIVSIVEED